MRVAILEMVRELNEPDLRAPGIERVENLQNERTGAWHIKTFDPNDLLSPGQLTLKKNLGLP